MYNKNNLMVTKIASKNSIKPEYGCVAFYGNRTIATDTFRLLEVSAEGEAHEPKMLPAKEVEQLVKLKKDQTVSLKRIEQMTGMVPNPHLQYPDVDVVLKSAEANEDYIEVKLNGRYLAEVALALSKIGAFEGVTMRVPKESGKPILMYSRAENEGVQTGRGLITPFNR